MSLACHVLEMFCNFLAKPSRTTSALCERANYFDTATERLRTTRLTTFIYIKVRSRRCRAQGIGKKILLQRYYYQ